MAERGMVIVGAGECGARAALTLRENGYAGPVTLVGAEPHPPYERPPLSKEMMLGEGEPAPKTIATTERLASAGVAAILDTAAAEIDRAARHVTLTRGVSVGYDKLLIATGAQSRHLPLARPGKRIHYLRTFDDAMSLRPWLRPGIHVAIIGGGFIGLEIAASARMRGAAVTVIEALPRILSRVVPEEIAAAVAFRHVHEGVDLRCGVGVAHIEEGREGVSVSLTDGQHFPADVLVIGIGAIPATAIAEDAALHVANGIIVDEYLRTSDPDIYAAGDCCSFPLAIYGGRRVRLESWRNAQDQGALAARNMAGANEALSALPWFWSDQYDLTLQIAGLPDEGGHTARREIGEDAFVLFHLADDGRLVAASGIGHGTVVARDIRLAEMLIAKRAHPDPALLASPAVKLKSLLAA